jgi:hypothetical protein
MTVQEFVNIDKDLQTVQDIVQSVVWRYNEFGDKLKDNEFRKLCDHMKR